MRRFTSVALAAAVLALVLGLAALLPIQPTAIHAAPMARVDDVPITNTLQMRFTAFCPGETVGWDLAERVEVVVFRNTDILYREVVTSGVRIPRTWQLTETLLITVGPNEFPNVWQDKDRYHPRASEWTTLYRGPGDVAYVENQFDAVVCKTPTPGPTDTPQPRPTRPATRTPTPTVTPIVTVTLVFTATETSTPSPTATEELTSTPTVEAVLTAPSAGYDEVTVAADVAWRYFGQGDADNKALPNVPIQVMYQGDGGEYELAQSSTDEDGKFTFSLRVSFVNSLSEGKLWVVPSRQFLGEEQLERPEQGWQMAIRRDRGTYFCSLRGKQDRRYEDECARLHFVFISLVPPTITPTPVPTDGPSPTPTVVLSPTPVPTLGPDEQPKVCKSLLMRVPPAVISNALANPADTNGWGQLCNEGVPRSEFNGVRRWLTPQNPNTPYHPLFNSVVWACSCQ